VHPLARAEITIDAPAEKLWRALTEPRLDRPVYVWDEGDHREQPGSPITYDGEWKGKPYRDKGTVLEVAPNRLLRTTHFSPLSGKEDIPENHNVVTYELTPQDGGTAVKVIQENNPDQNMVKRQASELLSAEERAAMKETLNERRCARSGEADGEADVLAKIAELPEPDPRHYQSQRSDADSENLVRGCPPTPRTAKLFASSRAARSSSRGTPRSVSNRMQTLTRAIFGQPPLP